tara:strand:- start:118 stop:660 length:543 start_codon:yes stop_codon:yes gene_type:complete
MYSHSKYGYRHFRDKFHIYIGLILPVIGYTITTVIGTNLALSLGMIGALSIIRFRTPVRSSYELIIYFLLLTVGISAKADIIISLLLTFVSVIIIYFLSKFYNNANIKEVNIKKNILFEMEFKDSMPNEILYNKHAESMVVKKNKEKNIVNLNINFDNNKDFEKFLEKWKDNILSYEIYN